MKTQEGKKKTSDKKKATCVFLLYIYIFIFCVCVCVCVVCVCACVCVCVYMFMCVHATEMLHNYTTIVHVHTHAQCKSSIDRKPTLFRSHMSPVPAI